MTQNAILARMTRERLQITNRGDRPDMPIAFNRKVIKLIFKAVVNLFYRFAGLRWEMNVSAAGIVGLTIWFQRYF